MKKPGKVPKEPRLVETAGLAMGRFSGEGFMALSFDFDMSEALRQRRPRRKTRKALSIDAMPCSEWRCESIGDLNGQLRDNCL